MTHIGSPPPIPLRSGCLVLTALAACSADRLGGDCGQTSDCPSGQTCVYDEVQNSTRCTIECESRLDCSPTETCVDLSFDPNPVQSRPDGQFCLSAVRECLDEEACNGLDDDCNGVVDDDCTPLACTREDQCGAFSCVPGEGANNPACAPRAEDPNRFFAPCTDDAQCPNGFCSVGFCSPLCRFDRAGDSGCPATLTLTGTSYPVNCAELFQADRPIHNACQIECTRPADCPSGLACNWRRILPSDVFHNGVCSELDPTRKPLGAACSNAFPDDGNLECQHGLCRNSVCTRLCDGSGADCTDVGDGFECRVEFITYEDLVDGEQTFRVFTCQEPAP